MASMAALCLLRASSCRSGADDAEISAERGSFWVSWRASIVVILPFFTVTRTWTLPYRGEIASPVAVPDAALDELEPELPEEPEPEEPLLDVVPELLLALLDVAAAVAAVAVW